MNPLPLRIRTVSVIERCEPGHIVVHTFPETPDGNAAAETFFASILREQDKTADGLRSDMTEEQVENGIEAALEAGYAEDGCGWELYLVHSET